MENADFERILFDLCGWNILGLTCEGNVIGTMTGRMIPNPFNSHCVMVPKVTVKFSCCLETSLSFFG